MRRPLAFLLLVLTSAPVGFAQGVRTADPQLFPDRMSRPKTDPTRVKTTVRVEVLHQGKLTGGVQAQQWSHVFARIGRSVRIRSPRFEEKPEIKETTQGTLRSVVAVGAIDTQGKLHFPGGRVFTTGQQAALKEYLTSLETFGAQGDPQGQPLWGLSKVQFDLVLSELQKPIPSDVKGKSIEQALEACAFPERMPISMTVAAKEWLKAEFPGQVPPVAAEVSGLSKGSGLAMLLNNYGLGLKPRRTPKGGLELIVDPLKTSPQVWPIGWESERPGHELAPKFFRLVPVALDDVKLVDVCALIAEQTGVPILFDRYRLGAKNIDVDALVVSHPEKRTSYSLAVGRLVGQSLLVKRLRIDEQGKAFIWVTVPQAGAAAKPRP